MWLENSVAASADTAERVVDKGSQNGEESDRKRKFGKPYIWLGER